MVARMIQVDDPGLLLQLGPNHAASTGELAIELPAHFIEAPAAARSHSISTRMLFAVCAVSLLAQGVLIVAYPQALVAFNLLIVLEFLCAAAGCLQFASSQNGETRVLWILVACGFLVSVAGQIEDTFDLLAKIAPSTATMADLFFLSYGIPVLLAISFTDDEAGLRKLFWLDGAQAIVAVVVVYFQIFTVLPSSTHAIAISTTSLMYVYDAENLVLAGAVTLRLFGNSSLDKRRVYIALSIYLWSYALAALALNYLEL
ncbi:MAG: hypothetical protein V4587_14645, partial [Acidobacteriota bacterium]